MSRQLIVRQHLFNLVLQYEGLEAERQKLLAAAERITVIQAEKAELIEEAQEALNRYNAVNGTTYTLQNVRSWYNASTRMVEEPMAPLP
jgi:hypothetical protein